MHLEYKLSDGSTLFIRPSQTSNCLKVYVQFTQITENTGEFQNVKDFTNLI